MNKKVLMAEMLEFNSEYTVGSHHYANLFARSGYEVLWLGPVFNKLYSLKNSEIYMKRKANSGANIHKIKENIYSYSPYSHFLYGNYIGFRSKVANKLSIKLTNPFLKKVLKESGFDKVDILWITNVKYMPLIDLIDYKKLIYRCSDDISGFDNCCSSMIELEEDIIKKSDVVFATARSLIEKKQNIRSDIKYLPNGVELENFIRNEYFLPSEFINDNKNKCIYVGAIESWFDLDLIYKSCLELKEINFYLIGPVKIDLGKLKSLPNLFILGKKNYEEIPNYIYYSDVALIPFKINELTNSITPIKLFEYMSLGKEVVSTGFYEMTHIKSPAYLSYNSNDFIDNIKQAINNKDKNKQRNIDFAKKCSWEYRFNCARQIIDGKSYNENK